VYILSVNGCTFLLGGGGLLLGWGGFLGSRLGRSSRGRFLALGATLFLLRGRGNWHRLTVTTATCIKGSLKNATSCSPFGSFVAFFAVITDAFVVLGITTFRVHGIATETAGSLPVAPFLRVFALGATTAFHTRLQVSECSGEFYEL